MMVNRKSKYLVALLLVVLMVFSVVGCSSKESTDTASETKAPVSGLRPEGVPEDFPNKEIEYIYGFSAGSVQDAYIRILFDRIKEMEGWDHGMVINYKEGASGRISWSAVANAKPDGYTIGFAPSAMLISAVAEDLPYNYDNMGYLFNMMSDPGAIGVATDSQYNSLEELVAAAKENPGEINVGVTSTIGQEGLTMKLIEKAAGVKFNVVAFNGGADVLAGVIGEHIDAFCLNVSDTTTFVEDKKVKVLATGAKERSQFLPDVPTYKEAGYDVMQVNMRAVAGPKDMPEPIRQYLENCLMAAAEDPKVKEQIADMQIPLDSLKGDEVEARFTNIGKNLEDLWNNDPWQ